MRLRTNHITAFPKTDSVRLLSEYVMLSIMACRANEDVRNLNSPLKVEDPGLTKVHLEEEQYLQLSAAL